MYQTDESESGARVTLLFEAEPKIDVSGLSEKEIEGVEFEDLENHQSEILAAVSKALAETTGKLETSINSIKVKVVVSGD